MSKLHSVLKKYIQTSGRLSLEKLSVQSDVSSNYIQKIIGGRANPSIEVQMRLAKAIGMSESDAFDLIKSKINRSQT